MPNEYNICNAINETFNSNNTMRLSQKEKATMQPLKSQF
jgi:hypothetical protein